MNKKQEIQAEIDEFSALLNEPSVPEDEKAFAKSEIARLQKSLDKIKDKKPAAAPAKKKSKVVSKAKMNREFGKEFMESKDKGRLREYAKPNNHVYISKERKKFVLIDKKTKSRWANEFFDKIDEALQFAKDNNLIVDATPTHVAQEIAAKSAPASANKNDDPGCDDLLAQYNRRKTIQQKSAKKSANTPVVKKDEKAVATVATRIKKHFKSGELTRPQIESLIKELTDKIKELKSLLKSSEGTGKKKFCGGGTVNSKSYSVPYNMKVTGIYKVTGPNIDTQISIAGHEAQNNESQSLYQSDLNRDENIKSVIVKNTSIKKMSQGKTVQATTTAGVKVKLTRIGDLFSAGGKTGNKEKLFLVTDKNPDQYRRGAPDQRPASFISQNWSDNLEDLDEDEETLADFLKDSTRGQIWSNDEYSFENIGFVEQKKTGGKAGSNKMVVTSISDIPDINQKVDAGKVTYRGLGMGKLADDFYEIAGESGVRIKVDKKEYFITDTDFRKLNWDFENERWLNKIKFSAPFRKYKTGGPVEGEEIDLFEHYETLPEEVQSVLAEYSDDDQDYESIGILKDKLEALGYTFDYGLDAVPYDLRKMSAKGGSVVSDLPKNRRANKKYSHFAVRKSDGKIAAGWETLSDIESLKHFAKQDLKDMDLKPTDFKILSKSAILRTGVNPFDLNNWIKPEIAANVKAKKGTIVKSRKQAMPTDLSKNRNEKSGTETNKGWKHSRNNRNK